ncbi:MAG: ABC transporter ATP-binding protein [Enterococcus casseliflavus]|nr:ABC transporter ATP-binding protein [Enterococcus casseliflavus]
MTLLNIQQVKKIYQSQLNGQPVEALKNITFMVEEGEYVAIMGESGSGKSTLLNLMATLDQPTAGEKQLQPIVQTLGIADLLQHYPYELSGGQKQRVAVARAIITKPELLLADEPTGALDSKTSDQLLTLFQQINQNGQTIVMVTHSSIAASRAQRVLFIKDGYVFHQLYRGDRSNTAFLEAIAETMTAVFAKEE